MKLHCEICALFDPVTGEYRIGDHTEIAVVNTEKLNLPLDASMFKSLMPERGLAAPWMPGAEWSSMKCPRGSHNIFVLWDERAEMATREGGPAAILTEEGWYPTKKAVEKSEEQTEDTRTEKILKMREAGFSNKKIAKRFSISRSRISQIIGKAKNET